jgi:hypothetical protein
MRERVPVRGVVDVEAIDPRTGAARRDRLFAIEASANVAACRWCGGVLRAYQGLTTRSFGLFLVRVEPVRGERVDRWLWATAGVLPSVYFVIDRAKTPAQALDVACELLEAWIAAVREGGALRDVFPVRLSPTLANAARLVRQITALRRSVPTTRERPRRRGARPRPRRATLMAPGDLVVDNLGRFGIALQEGDCPAADWLALQHDRRVVRHRRARWWQLLPMSGGSVMAPSPMLRRLGRPSPLQVAIAAHNATAFGRKTLCGLFGEPDH